MKRMLILFVLIFSFAIAEEDIHKFNMRTLDDGARSALVYADNNKAFLRINLTKNGNFYFDIKNGIYGHYDAEVEVEVTDSEGMTMYLTGYPAERGIGLLVPGNSALEKMFSQNDVLTISFRNRDYTPFSYTFQTWNFDEVREQLEKPKIIIE